ncbi:MAG: hypothetical protein J4F49_01100 [Rhodobacteraceae bacterium]|nr:hypothetical protein [Paracoccaceae bacterium]
MSKLVADAGLRVLLTGEGADELFYGYEKYENARAQNASVAIVWMAQRAGISAVFFQAAS